VRWIVTLTVTGMLLAAPVQAQATHRATHYCSPTGDICQSTQRVNGVRVLQVGLFAKFFSHYRLCVTAPDHTTTCHAFAIHAIGGTFGSKVVWKKHFPRKGPGLYTVVWRTGGARVGHILGFHQ
jgi:hypothetical protein